MIESVRFRNFKALRDTTLPLGWFTLMIGPNGSGKTTALQALSAAYQPGCFSFNRVASSCVLDDPKARVEVDLGWVEPDSRATIRLRWDRNGAYVEGTHVTGHVVEPKSAAERLQRIQFYELNARVIANDVALEREVALGRDGSNLAGVWDRLRDREQEKFDALNEDLGRWLPEFDRILFDTPGDGMRGFQLRTREGHYPIPAQELSQGTLLSLALLTLPYLPEPPFMVCLEEPDRGIHPRLLRQVKDALYRLCFPQEYGEKREPTQVVVTTHSPYMLDMYRDRPEEIVIADKIGLDVQFKRLSEQDHIEEILSDAQLGEIWYTGILGGVPLES